METQKLQETYSQQLVDQKLNQEREPATLLSSPSHEFSFTITLHPPPNSTPNPSPTLALDLAPADDIFFHGHLLPLHLLSHPRPSTDVHLSLPSSLPHTPTAQQQQQQQQQHNITAFDAKEKKKSFFGLSKLWVKGGDDEGEKKAKKKAGHFDMKHFLKKYTAILSSLNKEKRDDGARHQRPYTFSGNPDGKERDRWLRKRGEFSAPASMRTSPTNSGLILKTPAVCSLSSESSMDELQSAIQAAIAHCKSSTTTTKQENKIDSEPPNTAVVTT